MVAYSWRIVALQTLGGEESSRVSREYARSESNEFIDGA